MRSAVEALVEQLRSTLSVPQLVAHAGPVGPGEPLRGVRGERHRLLEPGAVVAGDPPDHDHRDDRDHEQHQTRPPAPWSSACHSFSWWVSWAAAGCCETSRVAASAPARRPGGRRGRVPARAARAAGAPAPLRRLVVPQGQARPAASTPVGAAVREAEEETGLHVRLARPLADQQLPGGGRPKSVHYWTGARSGRRRAGYAVNDEIDGVRWVRGRGRRAAAHLRPRPGDPGRGVEGAGRTTAVVVLRHAEARSRKAWRGDDRERPLLQRGRHRRPAGAAAGRLRRHPRGHLLQHPVRADGAAVRRDRRVGPRHPPPALRGGRRRRSGAPARRRRAGDGRGTVLCTHRPVLPLVFDALGLADRGPGARGDGGRPRAQGPGHGLERHLPR